MSKLMRHDARGEADRVTDLVQIVAELTNERFFGEWAGQEPSIGGQRIEGSERIVVVGRLHRQTSRLGPCVRSSTYRAARESAH